ncbi:MAG: hypothetical protein OEM52_02695 [bacterium]|nr:hypothetical protein [bacterium]
MLLSLGLVIFIVALLLFFAPRVLIRGNDIGNHSLRTGWTPPVSRIVYFLFHYRKTFAALMMVLALYLLVIRVAGVAL